MENIRTSSYIIPIKLVKSDDKYMLIHGYTGTIDIIDEELFEKFNNISSISTIEESTKQALIARGYLTTKSKEEEYSYVARIARALHQKDKILYKNFTLIVTYNCNFRCPYCFENRDLKNKKEQTVFTQDMVNNAFRAIEKIEPRKELRSSIITLYGGEPLLKENKNIVSYIIKEGNKRGFKFSAVTNGYDLDHFLDLLSPDKIYKLQITIDGTKDLHNQKRIHVQDFDTFDKIVSNIKLIQEKDIEIVVRVNTDNQNIDDFFKLNTFFKEQGIIQNKKFNIYSALLHNNENISLEEKQSLNFLSASSFVKRHEKMGTLSMCQNYRTFQKIYTAISTGTSIPFSSIFCASQSGGYVLDPLGQIYPCWETIGNKKYQLGFYSDNIIGWNDDMLQKWQGQNITNSDKCSRCKYALFCGGGCLAHIAHDKKTYCFFFQTMLKNTANRAFERFTDK